MRLWWVPGTLALATLAAPSGACGGGETGLIVEITVDPATFSAPIDTLHIRVGSRTQPGTDPTLWLTDEDASSQVDVSGRDLATDPYSVLLSDGMDGQGELLVAVGGAAAGSVIAFAALEQAQAFVDGEVIRQTLVLRGDATWSLLDSACVAWPANGAWLRLTPPSDADCDGYAADDCDDTTSSIHPDAGETCSNGIDDDCDGDTDEPSDVDGDGVTDCGGDCDDGDPDVYPGKLESCDGKDNDCDGGCDDTLAVDPDEDGTTECGTLAGYCDEPRSEWIDCGPQDPDVHPFATERCNGVDDDCDGQGAPPTPCFASYLDESGGLACALGEAACDDDASGDGSFGLTTCQGDNGTPNVSLDFCDAWTTCVTAEEPFECSLDAAATRQVECTLYVDADGIPCSGRSVPLTPFGTPTSCTWLVVGGMKQEHYEVGVMAGGSSPADSVSGTEACSASFKVIGGELVPQHDHLTLIFYPAELTSSPSASDGSGSVVDLTIAPVAVATCPDSPALVCTP